MPRLVALLILCAACAGEMRYRVDDTTIQGASVQERQGVMEAQEEVKQAQAEQQKTNQDLSQAKGLETTSKHDAVAADKAADDATAAQRTADQSHDVNQMNTANRNKVIAEASQRAAEAKSEWATKRRAALEKAKIAADKHVFAAQTRYELEKAKVVQQKNLGPIEVNRFEAQYEEARNDWQSAKNNADAAMTDANESERTYKEADKRYQEMRGGH